MKYVVFKKKKTINTLLMCFIISLNKITELPNVTKVYMIINDFE